MPSETHLHVAGSDAPVRLEGAFGELRHGADAAESKQNGGPIEAAVVEAMASPVGLPPLVRCFTEDDQVAFAVGAGVPRVDAVLRGLLAGLAEAKIGPSQVTVVTAEAEPTLAEGLADAADAGLKIVAHDPADEENLCFAGVDERDEPLRINRQLFEADVLLPVTCAHAPGHPAAIGAFGDLYPVFGDAEAINRIASAKGRGAHRDDADRAGWVLGVMISVQVTPGVAGGVAEVFAGESQQVEREASRRCGQLWTAAADEPASLVVVTLGGEPERQSWRKLGAALDAADRLAAPGAAVAVVSQLTAAPPQALIELADADSPDATLHRLQSKRDADLPLARSVAAALERGPLYLMSRLDPDDTESLGMAPLAGDDELQRLVTSRPSVLVLHDAEHAVASLAGESPSETAQEATEAAAEDTIEA